MAILNPIVEALPKMDAKRFESLVADIEANGLREPITLDADGRVIDGRHRLQACIRLGIEPRYETLPAGADVVAVVQSLNLERRHLKAGELARAAARLRKFAREQGKKITVKQAAEITGASERSIERADAEIDDQRVVRIGEESFRFRTKRRARALASALQCGALDAKTLRERMPMLGKVDEEALDKALEFCFSRGPSSSKPNARPPSLARALDKITDAAADYRQFITGRGDSCTALDAIRWAALSQPGKRRWIAAFDGKQPPPLVDGVHAGGAQPRADLREPAPPPPDEDESALADNDDLRGQDPADWNQENLFDDPNVHPDNRRMLALAVVNRQISKADAQAAKLFDVDDVAAALKEKDSALPFLTRLHVAAKRNERRAERVAGIGPDAPEIAKELVGEGLIAVADANSHIVADASLEQLARASTLIRAAGRGNLTWEINRGVREDERIMRLAVIEAQRIQPAGSASSHADHAKRVSNLLWEAATSLVQLKSQILAQSPKSEKLENAFAEFYRSLVRRAQLAQSLAENPSSLPPEGA